MTLWARTEWLGLRPQDPADPVEVWAEVWELLEDTLVLRGDVLSDVARGARVRASGERRSGASA